MAEAIRLENMQEVHSQVAINSAWDNQHMVSQLEQEAVGMADVQAPTTGMEVPVDLVMSILPWEFSMVELKMELITVIHIIINRVETRLPSKQ